MKRMVARRLLMVSTLAAALLVSPAIWADDSNPRMQIVVGSERDYPPYAMINSAGQADGFGVDLMKAVCETMGIDVTFRAGVWSEVRAALEKGEVDALALVSYSKEREKAFDFTMPHSAADAVVFKRKATPAIGTVSNLRDKAIIVMRSDAAHDWLLRNDVSGKLVLTATLPEAFRMLAAGQHDYLLAPRLVGLLTAKSLGLTDIDTTGPLIDAYGRGYAFAVKKGNTTLLLKLNEGLRVIRETGRYAEIYDRWFGGVDSKGIQAGVTVQYVLWGMAALGVLGGVVVVWVVILRRVVRKQTAELAEVRDTLELNVAERTRELEDRNFILDAVIDGTSNAVSVKDRDGRFLLINRVKARHLGLKPEDVIGKTDQAFFPPDVAAERMALDRAVIETGTATDIDEEIPFQGKTRIFHTYRTPYRDGVGNIIGVIGIARDITKRRRAEEELEAQQRLLESIIETIPHGIFWKDRNVVYRGCNSTAARNWYLDRREDLVGKTAFELARDKDEAEMIARTDRFVMEEGKPLVNFEDTHMRADGTVATHLSSKLPLRDAAGNVTGLLCIFLDISDRLAAEKQLRHAQRAEALGSLAGGIAHELNNLLLPILALSKMAEKRAPDGSPERMRLAKIVEASERSAQIVKQILAFSRDEDEEKTVIDIAAAIGESVGLLETALPSTITFQRRIASDVGGVLGVTNQIQTVVVNLVTNSVEAIEGKPGQITLSLDRIELDTNGVRELPEIGAGTYARIVVQDTGKGIPPDILDRVLDPFFTTKEAGAGIGMGLATVNAIVTRHEGAIRIFSKPGEATRVEIYLPVTKQKVDVAVDAQSLQRPYGIIRMVFGETIRQARGAARCGASGKPRDAAGGRRRPPCGPGPWSLGVVAHLDRSAATLGEGLLAQGPKPSVRSIP